MEKEAKENLRAKITVLSNSLIDANKSGANPLQESVMGRLLEVIANEPEGLSLLSELQGKEDSLKKGVTMPRPLLSSNARKLAKNAVKADMDPRGINEELSRKVNIALEKGSERVTRGDLSLLAREVRARTERIFVSAR